jgi:hypothetical protein
LIYRLSVSNALDGATYRLMRLVLGDDAYDPITLLMMSLAPRACC